MAQGRHAHVVLLALAAGCGSRAAPPPPLDKKDAGPVDAGAAVELEPLVLGLPDLAAYRWRQRAGQPAFRRARTAEARDDWAAVVEACRQALAADPGHLDAAWLLAVGLAKLGKPELVVAPLARAAAGDFAKWGQASLELPGLQAFLATPTGEAWRRRVELDRARYAAAISRSVIVTADGDLHAVELDGARWYRLTRTAGVVIGAIAVPSAHKVAYLSRARRAGKPELAVGVVDLARGAASHPIALGAQGAISVAYSARTPVGFWVGAATGWRQLDDDFRFHPLPPKTARPGGSWFEVTAKGAARLHALPPNVTADWDEQSLASAIRIGTSNRVVSVPSPGLIDGNSAAWSPDRVHLAFVAQLDDHCAPGAVNTAAFVADGSTGGTKELERAARGIAFEWLSERTLAIAGDHGVTLRSLDDGPAPIVVVGATGLMFPRERPRCAPPDGSGDAADDAEPPEPGSGDEPSDAGAR